MTLLLHYSAQDNWRAATVLQELALMLVAKFFEDLFILDFDEVLVITQNAALVMDLHILPPLANETVVAIRHSPAVLRVYLEESCVAHMVRFRILIEHELWVTQDARQNKPVFVTAYRATNAPSIHRYVSRLLILVIAVFFTEH